MVIVMSAMTSCRDELCYHHYPSLDVSLSWEHEWERDYGMNHPVNWDASLHGFGYDALRPGMPEWVNLIHFAADGTRNENYLSNAGDNVMVDYGDGQSLLLYNGDTEYIIFSDIASPPDARASATSRTRTSLTAVTERHPTARTTNPPDVLYSAYISDISDIKMHEIRPLSVKMQPLVFTYVVRYEFEYGLQHVRQARGALGGMAESVYLLDGRTSEETTIIIYDCELKDYGCEAHVRSFGVPGFPDEYYGRAEAAPTTRPYTLNLEVLLQNGKTLEFNFDIAEQLAKQPKGGVIRVDGIRIEDEQNVATGSESGFDVDLSGWGNVEVDLPVVPDKRKSSAK